MINRYSYEEMSSIFSEVAKFKRWLQVELAVTGALSDLGIIQEIDYKNCLTAAPKIDEAFVQMVEERELVTNHDLAAFVDVVQTTINNDSAKWIHFGLTSSDVVDTAFSLSLKSAGIIILKAVNELIELLKNKAIEHRDTAMTGRTHGIHAEPTTFGTKLALFGFQVIRDKVRLEQAIEAISVGKLSGAVGTYSNINPQVESIVCDKLQLTPTPATQVISRDRHAQYMYAIVSLACTVELIATEIRHLARTELSEATESFGSGQKGSSAMPHKKNPILSERLVGLSRVMRGYLVSTLEDIALWHERDISHSSVERIVFSDASILIHYMLKKTLGLVANLEVNKQAMIENLNSSFGVVFSQSLLLKLVEKGQERDAAYRMVQRNSHRALAEKVDLKTLVLGDTEIMGIVTEKDIETVFDLDRILKNTNITIDKLKETAI